MSDRVLRKRTAQPRETPTHSDRKQRARQIPVAPTERVADITETASPPQRKELLSAAIGAAPNAAAAAATPRTHETIEQDDGSGEEVEPGEPLHATHDGIDLEPKRQPVKNTEAHSYHAARLAVSLFRPKDAVVEPVSPPPATHHPPTGSVRSGILDAFPGDKLRAVIIDRLVLLGIDEFEDFEALTHMYGECMVRSTVQNCTVAPQHESIVVMCTHHNLRGIPSV